MLQRGSSSRLCVGVSVLALSGLVLAGCSSAAEPTPGSNVTSQVENVDFKPCTPQTCTGKLNGFPYEVLMPKKWNGTLLIYSHGFRSVNAAPPMYRKFVERPEPAPGWGEGAKAVGQTMLAQGYALAGAATTQGGWQVDEQVQAAELLHQHFVDTIAMPNRVYTWGDSLGALSSLNLSEKNDWVNGAAPLCGLSAGLNPNFDLALDAAFSVKSLLYPKMRLVNYSSYSSALKTYTAAMKAVKKAAKDKFGKGALKLSVIAEAAALPTKTATLSGGGVFGDIKPIVQGLALVLARGTTDRYYIERQFHGDPSSNVGTNYYARVTYEEQAAIDTFSKGATVKYLKIIQQAPRVKAQQAARDAAAKNGALTGALRVPTVSLHTQFDQLAIVQNESQIYVKALRSANDQARLFKPIVTSPPAFYPENGKTPYGAGHCNFTADSVIGTVALLDDWVRYQQFPTDVSTDKRMGLESGYDKDFVPPAWPPGTTQQPVDTPLPPRKK